VLLEEALARLRAQRASLAAADCAALDDALDRLRMLQVAEQGPQAGEPFPDFALVDPSGAERTSAALLAAGPLVLVFFRGGWCEYCDATMHAYDAIVPDITAAGATLVGVVPESPATLAATRAAKGLSFELLADLGARLARLCGLDTELTPGQIALYRRERGLDLPARHAGTGWELPVPAAYVIDPAGTVVLAHADADYTRRAEPRDLLAAVRGLAAGG
jgi:peroxiredoxin